MCSIISEISGAWEKNLEVRAVKIEKKGLIWPLKIPEIHASVNYKILTFLYGF